jgi:hypothetical protein
MQRKIRGPERALWSLDREEQPWAEDKLACGADRGADGFLPAGRKHIRAERRRDLEVGQFQRTSEQQAPIL